MTNDPNSLPSMNDSSFHFRIYYHQHWTDNGPSGGYTLDYELGPITDRK